MFVAACGVLLGLAGVLKIAYLVSVGRASEWPVEMLMAIAAGELLTGVWFVVHARRLLTRIAGVVVFASLAIASATMHFYGIAACPCLGILHVSPFGMLVADIAILAGFIALCSTLVKSDIWQAVLELKTR